MSTTTPPTETVAIGTFDDNQKVNPVRRILRTQAFQILLVLLAIIIVFSILAPDSFAQWTNFRLIIQNGLDPRRPRGRMTYVIITAGIDLSVGSVLVFSGVVAALVMRAMGGRAGASRSSASWSRS